MNKKVNSYENLLEDILDLGKNYIVIRGISDVEDGIFKDLKEEDYYIVIGHADPMQLIDTLSNSFFLEDNGNPGTGEYEYSILLRHNNELGWNDPINTYEFLHMEYTLLRTFKQRDRSEKLGELLYEDDTFGGLFKNDK